MMVRNIVLSTVLIALAGCGGVPFHSQHRDEIPEGPGLFSGEKGYFVLYSDEAKKQQADAAATGDRSKADPPSAATSAEYQEFTDYEEFRRWKTSAKDGPEYREFQEWREWKAYRAWKERQPK